MSSPLDPTHDLEQLLRDLVDGELSHAQQQHLAALLRNDPLLQKHYRDYLLLDALLHWEQLEIVPLPAADAPRRPHRFRPLLCLLAASVLVVFGVYWLYRWPAEAERGGPPSLAVEGDSGALEPQASGLAVLSRGVQVQWEANSPRIGVGATLGAGPLHLKSGLVQLEFYRGATVMVEGPAHLELLSSDCLRVWAGKLRAIVPPQARGFTILSSTAEVVDLGTEFGLQVNGAGRTQVHVFRGKVEVYEPRSLRSGNSCQEVVAGHGLQVDEEGRRLDIPVDNKLFLSREEVNRQAQRQAIQRRQQWRQFSERLRRDNRLIAYYSFQDRPTDGSILRADNLTDTGLDGAIIGCEGVKGRWPGKRALEFKRSGDRVRLRIPGSFDALTLMAWVRVDALEQRFNALFLTDGFEFGAPHWQITQEGKIRLGIRNSVEANGFQNYDTPVVFRPEELGQWQHLATVYDAAAGRMAHYVNGQRLMQKALRGARVRLSIGNAEIGNWGTPSNFRRYPIRNFNGRIDEFALFKAALSDDDIQKLYRSGEPSP